MQQTRPSYQRAILPGRPRLDMVDREKWTMWQWQASLALNPRAEHEQAGGRPAMVISPEFTIAKPTCVSLVPLRDRRYAFDAEIANADGTTTVVLTDHLRNAGWKAHDVQLIRRVAEAELSEVIARIDTLLVSPDG